MSRERSVLANNLKIARDLKGWTQKDLALKANLKVAAIEKIEASFTLDPRLSTLKALSYALKMPIDLLVEDKSDYELSYKY